MFLLVPMAFGCLLIFCSSLQTMSFCWNWWWPSHIVLWCSCLKISASFHNFHWLFQGKSAGNQWFYQPNTVVSWYFFLIVSWICLKIGYPNSTPWFIIIFPIGKAKFGYWSSWCRAGLLRMHHLSLQASHLAIGSFYQPSTWIYTCAPAIYI